MKIILTIASVFAVAWYWQDSLRSRELILKRCRQFCDEHDVQFLDQSVYVARVRLAKSKQYYFFLRRFYAFEFSISGMIDTMELQ